MKHEVVLKVSIPKKFIKQRKTVKENLFKNGGISNRMQGLWKAMQWYYGNKIQSH